MNTIKQRFDKLGLNQKFTIITLVLLLIPVLIYTIVFFQYRYHTLIQEEISEVKNDIAKDKSSFQKVMELGNMTAQIFSEHQELKTFLTELKKKESLPVEQYIKFYKKHIPILEALVNSNPYLYQVRIYAENDTFPEMVPILYHKEQMALFSWSKEERIEGWHFDYPDKMISKDDKSHLMSLVRIIRDDFGEKIGVMEIVISMKDNFFDLYTNKEDSWSCFFYNNKILTQDFLKKEWEKEKDTLVSVSQNIEETKVITTELHGEKIIAVIEPVEELEGSYIRVVSIEKEYQDIIAMQYQICGLLILCFCFIAFFINKVVRSLLKHFYEVLDVVRIVQKGNLDKRVAYLGNNEMGEMGKQINRMLDKIQVLMRENVEHEILAKNTELKALQNQINAHFIYNVLESIKMMAEIDEKYEISDAITSLGELLRYNMKWVSGNVSIKEEITYIQNYIQLMNLRYDFTILLCIKIEDSIYEQKIPKMSLQPIVENAICHGIVGAQEDATIYIRSVRHGSDFEIAITDSGIGMTEEQRQLLERKIRGEADVDCCSGNGIGLKNVQDRIQMQFGNQYGLEFYSKEGCFTKVRILLPIRE